jgi:hypothetical protein
MRSLVFVGLLAAVAADATVLYTVDSGATTCALSLHNKLEQAVAGVPNVTAVFSSSLGVLSAVGVSTSGSAPTASLIWANAVGPMAGVTRVAAARHIGAFDDGVGVPTAAGDVDVAVVTLGNAALGITAMATTSSDGSTPTPTPRWATSITGGATVDVADDGTFVAVVTADGKLSRINAQSGAVNGSIAILPLVAALPQCANASLLGLSVDRSARMVLLTLACTATDSAVVVVDTQLWAARGTPFVVTASGGDAVVPATICPMGVFIMSGSGGGATIRRWNSTAAAYTVQYTLAVADGTYQYSSAVASVNGEDANPDGCYAALAWINANGDGVLVEAYSMLTGEMYVTWLHSGATAVNGIASHLQYFAVATDAGVLLFSLYAPKPIAVLTGVALSFDLVVMPSYQPLVALESTSRTADNATDSVFVAAAFMKSAALYVVEWPSH